MAQQRSETSANLRMAFTPERFPFRKVCIGVYAADKGIPMLTASLCLAVLKGDFWESFCSWVVLTIEKGKEREMVASGKVGCRPMGKAAEGRIERAKRKKCRK